MLTVLISGCDKGNISDPANISVTITASGLNVGKTAEDAMTSLRLFTPVVLSGYDCNFTPTEQ